MANDIVQTIAEARVDARSLSEFVFKPADFMVARRLAPSVRTLQYYVDFFNTMQSNIATTVSAAQSSLNNSVAEAQGKVAYIESTVQDAINNTAVEGGILADTFVVVDGNQSQRDVNWKTARNYVSVADMVSDDKLKAGQWVATSGYYNKDDGGGTSYKIEANTSQVIDGGSCILLSNGLVANALFDKDNLKFEHFGVKMDKAIDSYVAVKALVDFVNANNTIGYTVVFNGEIATSMVVTVTADNFTIKGDGSWFVHSSIAETESKLLVMNGINPKIDGIHFDGNVDTTDRPYSTPKGNMVNMGGANPYFSGSTANAQGYALTISGKNPVVPLYEDYNSEYCGLRFFPQESWNFARVGDVHIIKRNTNSFATISTRGIIFNGKQFIDSVRINSVYGDGSGILLDAGEETDGGLPKSYYPYVEIGSLILKNLIPSSTITVGLAKFENIGTLKIGYCEGYYPDSDNQSGFWFNGVHGQLEIDTFKCNQSTRLPIRSYIKTATGYGSLKGGSLFFAASNTVPCYWNFDTVVWDEATPVPLTSTFCVIRPSSPKGSKVIVNSYIETLTKANLYSTGVTQSQSSFYCGTPKYTHYTTGAASGKTQVLPRQHYAYNIDGVTGDVEVGDIYWRSNIVSGGYAGWIITKSGTLGVDAEYRDFCRISNNLLEVGTTAQRPPGARAGFYYFDTTLNKPIFKGDSSWLDATGATV